jgi:hypothetical protein
MFIDTALDFLVKQIYTTRQKKAAVAMQLSLNRTGALHRVVSRWLLRNMGERKILKCIVKWVGTFMINGTTSLCPLGFNTGAISMQTGIPWAHLCC